MNNSSLCLRYQQTKTDNTSINTGSESNWNSILDICTTIKGSMGRGFGKAVTRAVRDEFCGQSKNVEWYFKYVYQIMEERVANL